MTLEDSSGEAPVETVTVTFGDLKRALRAADRSVLAHVPTPHAQAVWEALEAISKSGGRGTAL